MRAGDKAWIALGVGIGTYELLCPESELMSEAASRYMVRHPWLVRVVAFMLAAHVCSAIPATVDPLHQALRIKRHFSRRA